MLKVSASPVRILVGPTASGKSAVAVALAQRHRLEIVSMDSMQVYRGMPILSQVLPVGERAGVPHHLTEILDPDEPFDTAAFLREAARSFAIIAARGHEPLVVGGTGLYLKALIGGLTPVGGRVPELREALDREAGILGPEALWTRLAALDPVRATRVHPHDLRRIVRALEIAKLGGRPPTDLYAAGQPAPVAHRVVVGLRMDALVLDRRIAGRSRRMWEAGLVEEIRSLIAGAPPATCAQALGFRIVRDLIEGRLTDPQARDRLERETRRFARRQLRLFTRIPGIRWVDVAGDEQPDELAARVQALFGETWLHETKVPYRDSSGP